MAVPTHHVLRQGPMIRTLLRSASQAMRPRPAQAPPTPGAALTATVPPRSARLVADYVRHVGGDPAWYRGQLPAHLFPQWGFPLLSRCLDDLPYDLRRVLNGGCRIALRVPIPPDEPLELRANLERIDDNGSRAVIETRLVTGTASVPEAMTATIFAIVPLGKRDGEPKKAKPNVPVGDREIDTWRLGARAGWEFAVLTGDFNPVHWIPPYARAAGFARCILHGFSTLARAIESVNRNVHSGDVSWLRTVDVRFVRPVVLPTELDVFYGPGRVSVGEAPGGPAFLVGDFNRLETADA